MTGRVRLLAHLRCSPSLLVLSKAEQEAEHEHEHALTGPSDPTGTEPYSSYGRVRALAQSASKDCQTEGLAQARPARPGPVTCACLPALLVRSTSRSYGPVLALAKATLLHRSASCSALLSTSSGGDYARSHLKHKT